MSDSVASDPPFTPGHERESSKVGFGSYVWKVTKALIITKLAAVAGGVAGDKLWKGRNGATWGYLIAGIGTAAYEGHQHWKPIKGTQRRLEEIMPEIAVELNPDTLKEETALQKQVHEGLTQQHKMFTQLVDKRKPDAIESRGSAMDALAKETPAEITNGGR